MLKSGYYKKIKDNPCLNFEICYHSEYITTYTTLEICITHEELGL